MQYRNQSHRSTPCYNVDSVVCVTIMTEDAAAVSPGSARQPDDHVHIRFHRVSTWASLRGTVLSWFHVVGVRPVLLEICSCYHRILLRRKIGSSLSPEVVRLSLPSPEPDSGSASRSETQSCIQGIQALSKERPWLTLPDIELFLQGWFGAERCVQGNLDSRENTSGVRMDS